MLRIEMKPLNFHSLSFIDSVFIASAFTDRMKFLNETFIARVSRRSLEILKSILVINVDFLLLEP